MEAERESDRYPNKLRVVAYPKAVAGLLAVPDRTRKRELPSDTVLADRAQLTAANLLCLKQGVEVGKNGGEGAFVYRKCLHC